VISIVLNKRKKKILDAAHRLFIERGFHTTSIQDILDEAEISKGTFYNYFGSKNECLLAILENVQAEGDQKRIELTVGKSTKDEVVFIQQMAVRSNMNRKYNMLALFDAIHHLDDPEIREFLRKQYKAEIQWVSIRVTEIFGQETRDYAIDFAVMFLGAIHHFMHVWKMGTDEVVEPEKVIRFILNRFKPIFREQVKTGERFFPFDWLGFELEAESVKDIITPFVRKIDGLLDKVKAEQLDYLLFLKDEIQSNNPRRFLIESIVLSLTNIFKNTKLEHEVWQIVQLTEKFIHFTEIKERE
jgi:AcrR family transcriptional regulator